MAVDNRVTKLTQMAQQLQTRWGWFMALGVILLLLGFFAMSHVVGATLVSVVFIALMIIAGGVAQIIHAWAVRVGVNAFLWGLAGVLYILAGIFTYINPVAGAVYLTLLLGGILIAIGFVRLWIWYQNRSQGGWQWLAFSGVLSLAVGLLVAADWPENSLWILGMLLAVDLMFQGWSFIWVSLGLRNAGKK